MTTRTCCSLCIQPGHNIRTCQDERITETWTHLLTTWVIPRIGNVFTQDDQYALWLYLAYIPNRRLLYAIGIRYAHTKLSDFVQTHASCIRDRIIAELESLNAMNEAGKDEWHLQITGRHYVPPVFTAEEPVFINSEHFQPYHPVIDTMMLCIEPTELSEMLECVICQDEKTKIAFNTTNCGHSFCHNCICSHIEYKQFEPVQCPLCRADITSLSARDIENFENLDQRFSRTAAVLKDCCIMAFGTTEWADQSFDNMIHMFLYNFIHHTDLIEDMYSRDSYLVKAEVLWQFLYSRM